MTKVNGEKLMTGLRFIMDDFKRILCPTFGCELNKSLSLKEVTTVDEVCNDKSDCNNLADELFCPNRFFCGVKNDSL